MVAQAQGLAALPSLAENTNLIGLIELGGNDGLRDLNLKQLSELAQMIELSKKQGTRDFSKFDTSTANFIEKFENIYPELAKQYQIIDAVYF